MRLIHPGVNGDLLTYWRSGGLPAIPAGAIFANANGIVPAGWTRQNAGITDNCAVKIVGTSTHLSKNTQYNEVVRTFAITAGGGHTGTGRNMAGNGGGMGLTADPDHDHGGTQNEARVPFLARLGTYLIKADVDTDDLPANTIWFADDTEDKSAKGFTRSRNSTYGKDSHIWMLSGTGISWYDDETTPSVTPAVEPAHDHGNIRGALSSGGTQTDPKGQAAGAHQHGAVFPVYTIDPYEYLFNAWYNIGTAISLRGGYDPLGVHALWESDTPPPGWAIWDRHSQCFLSIAYDLASGGTARGTDKYSASGSPPISGGHNHHDGDVSNTFVDWGNHIDTVGDHTHTWSFSNQNYNPNRVYFHLIQRLW